MQKGASFNMEAVKAQIQAAIAAQTGKSDCTAALPVAQTDSAALLETVLFPKGGLEGQRHLPGLRSQRLLVTEAARERVGHRHDLVRVRLSGALLGMFFRGGSASSII